MATTYNEACGCARKHLGIARVNLAEAVEQSARDANSSGKLSSNTSKSADNAWENLCTAESEHFVEMIQGAQDEKLKEEFTGLMDRTRKVRQELMLSGAPLTGTEASQGLTEKMGKLANEVENIKHDLDKLGVEYKQEQIVGCDRCVDFMGGEKAKVDLNKFGSMFNKTQEPRPRPDRKEPSRLPVSIPDNPLSETDGDLPEVPGTDQVKSMMNSLVETINDTVSGDGGEGGLGDGEMPQMIPGPPIPFAPPMIPLPSGDKMSGILRRK